MLLVGKPNSMDNLVNKISLYILSWNTFKEKEKFWCVIKIYLLLLPSISSNNSFVYILKFLYNEKTIIIVFITFWLLSNLPNYVFHLCLFYFQLIFFWILHYCSCQLLFFTFWRNINTFVRIRIYIVYTHRRKKKIFMQQHGFDVSCAGILLKFKPDVMLKLGLKSSST